ncbi:MAG: DUF4292 domain-containing protein [Nitrospirota bacterium]
MQEKETRNILFSLLVLLFAYSCTTTTPKVDIYRDRTLDAKEIAEILNNRFEEFKGYKAIVEFKLEGNVSQSLNGALLVKKPDRLRLQGFAFGGITLFDLLIAGSEMKVYLPSLNKTMVRKTDLYTEEERNSLWKFYQALLLGSAHSKIKSITQENDLYVLLLEDGKKVWVDKGNLNVLRQELFSQVKSKSGEKMVTIYYDDYRKVETMRLPHRIKIEDGNNRLTIKFKELIPNPAFTDEDFTITGAPQKVR